MFSRTEIAPEGSSGAGLFTALNVLVHRDVRVPILPGSEARKLETGKDANVSDAVADVS